MIHEVFFSDNIDDMVSRFKFFLLKLFDNHIPMVSKCVAKKPNPWINYFIRQLYKQRDSGFHKAKHTQKSSRLE